jgi:hypothetical protein
MFGNGKLKSEWQPDPLPGGSLNISHWLPFGFLILGVDKIPGICNIRLAMIMESAIFISVVRAARKGSLLIPGTLQARILETAAL